MKERLRKMGHLQPINIFLRQEIDRMQRVITRVRLDLKDLKLAIDGTIIMSENLRDALDNMFDARVPTTWRKVGLKMTGFCNLEPGFSYRNIVFEIFKKFMAQICREV